MPPTDFIPTTNKLYLRITDTCHVRAVKQKEVSNLLTRPYLTGAAESVDLKVTNQLEHNRPTST